MNPINLGIAVVWFAKPMLVDVTAYALWVIIMLMLVGYVAAIIYGKSKHN